MTRTREPIAVSLALLELWMIYDQLFKVIEAVGFLYSETISFCVDYISTLIQLVADKN